MSIPARELRVGMLLYLRSSQQTMEITEIEQIGHNVVDGLPMFYGISAGEAATFLLKAPGDLVNVVVGEFDY